MKRDFPWVPVGLGVAAGIGVGVVLGRTVFAPRTLPSGAVGKVQQLASDQEWKMGEAAKQIEQRGAVDDGNWMANPFALAALTGKYDASRETSDLSSVAAALGLSALAIVSDKSPIRRNALVSEYVDAQRQRGSRDPYADEWVPPDIGGTHTFRVRSMEWAYAGAMFPWAPRFTDPSQGSITNCMLISAMSSVALVEPDAITRAVVVSRAREPGEWPLWLSFWDGERLASIGTNEDVPTYSIVDSGTARRILPCAQSLWSWRASNYPLWPAVYEKAFAKNQFGVMAYDRGSLGPGDFPNLTLANYWWSRSMTETVPALTALTGRPTRFIRTASMSADEIDLFVQSLAPRGVSTAPTTVGSADESALSLSEWLAGAIVPAHAYSVLGRVEHGGRQYVVLRNPWGDYRPVGHGTFEGPWNGMTLPSMGCFALEKSLVKRYFGTGAATIYTA
jgi:hypothetical protein